MQDKENCEFSPSLIIPLNNRKGNGIYRVRTLIDSGSGSSWIAKDILPKITYTLLGHKKLRVRTFGQEVEDNFKIVQIYFENHNTKYAVNCYVINNFLKHILVKGLKDYLRKHCKLSEQVFSRIVDPTDCEIDHRDINEGTGLVLSNEDVCLITKETNSRLCLKDKRLILDDTYFGITVSGKVPNSLLKETHIVQSNWAIPRIVESGDVDEEIGMYQADVEEKEVETIDGCQACSQRCVLEDQLKILEDKEHLGITKSEWQHMDDIAALDHYKETLKRLPNGQFEVRLPVNDMIELLKPNEKQSKAKAYRQHNKCLHDRDYGVGSSNEMIKLRTEDYVEKVTKDTPEGKRIHYLSHRAIEKKTSKTTKYRVVMDASARPSKYDVSLNQCLRKGPNLIVNLSKCILQFMIGKFACTADIEKAFLRIMIALEDRDLLRFFYPANPLDPNSPMEIWRYKALLFGAISSPFILAAVLDTLIENSSLPQHTKEVLKKGIYVDNLFHASDYEKELCQFYRESRELLEKGGFKLRQWSSNSETLKKLAEAQEVWDESEFVGALGMLWKPGDDKFYLKMSLEWDGKWTKRSVLSFVNSVFDPLCKLCPIHIRNRLFLQRLWKEKYQWDKSFEHNSELAKQWQKLMSETKTATKYSWSRPVIITSNSELHIFADASKEAYGAVAYVVTRNGTESPEGQVWHMMAKGKVEPIQKVAKRDTIPKGELLAIVIAANLVCFLKDAIKQLVDIPVYIWSDNKTALSWCSQTEIKTRFVYNRVDNIRKLLPVAKIGYVKTDENPADILTRYISGEDLLQSQLWWKATKWILHEEWKKHKKYELHPEIIDMNIVQQERMETLLEKCFDNTPGEFYNKLRKFSIYTRWISIYRENKKTKENCELDPTENYKKLREKWSRNQPTGQQIIEARIIAMKNMQKQCFKEEVETLERGEKVKFGRCATFQLYMDKQGLIRCHSRVRHRLLHKFAIAPVLVEPENCFIKAYLIHLHKCNNHAHTNSTLNKVRQMMHGPGIKRAINKVVGYCMNCKRIRASPYRYPVQPDLPMERYLMEIPFTCTGVDYAGPYDIREHGEIVDIWVIIFTCMVSRAVYLISVRDLTAETFIQSLKELDCRRTTPKIIMSDNAATFTQASKILSLIKEDPKVQVELGKREIEWKFTPVKAPRFGAIYERLIGIMKKELAKMTGTVLFTEHDFKGHLMEVEKVMNNRPLVEAGSNEVITPAHMLHGAQTNYDTQLISLNTDKILNNMIRTRKQIPELYRKIAEKKMIFWEKFIEQYLETLRFSPDRTSNRFAKIPEKGDVCIVYDKRYPKHKWQLCLILETIKSLDGEIRKCKIKIGKVESERTVEQLYPLELNAEEFAETVRVKIQREREEKRKKMKEGIIEEVEVEVKSDRPRRQMAINARERFKEMYKEDLA